MLDWVSPQTDTVKDWHVFRGKGIGSSDVPVIMGVSPWKNIYDLWLEKTDQLPEEKKFKGNWATQRGTRLEPIVREMYEKKTGYKFQAENIANKKVDFVRASFDGINHELKRVLEIKCPGKKSHEEALNGSVPEVYYPQCQWLMLVCGYNELDYVSWDGKSDDYVCIRLLANVPYQNEMLNLASQFWDHVINKTPPEIDAPIDIQLKEMN